MKKCVIFLFAIFSFLNAWYDYINYKIDYIDIYDSLKQLPPRLRGFGDEDYFETFIKPQVRDSLNVRCVGRWPFGPGFEVYGDTSNNILCFGSGSGVLVFDIADPANPVRLSQIAVNGLIMQIYIRDSLLFVASYGNGIEVFNLTNPSVPVKISQINVPARDFCLKDTFAYCVAEDSLRIINISDILNPFQVGACWDSSYTISISGNYVYTGGRWKLSAIDVTNPANPQVVNSLGVWVYTLTVDGNHCYCVLNTNGFTIYNVSDPMNIWQESQLNTVGGVDIYKLGFYVYLPGFVIVDVGDSANPFVVGDTVLPVYAQAVWVNDNFGYAYIANDYVGLTPININDPTNPIALASIYGADDSRDVFVQGNYAYVANQRKGLKIIDVVDPTTPYEVGEYDTVGTYPNLRTVWSVDTLVYIPTEWPFVFKILNVSNPSLPSLLGYCRMRTIGEDLFVKDSFAYAVGTAAFQAFRISNPLNPESLLTYLLPHDISYAVFVKDTFAYIANADSGLRILNIANPAIPFEVGHFDNPPGGYAMGIFVKDTLAYFASGAPGLRIINVKDPTNPQEIGYYITTGSARDIIIVDSLAYVAAAGVRVIKINNPLIPIEVGYYITSDAPNRLFYDGSYIFVACFESGMDVLEWLGTGIEERNNNKAALPGLYFELAPTITKRYLNLFLCSAFMKNCNVVAYDVVGRKVLEVLPKRKVKGSLQEKIDMQIFPNGIYFIAVESEDVKLVKKVIIVH